MDSASVTRILHTRFALIVATVLAVVGAALSFYLSDGITLAGSTGFVSSWSLGPQLCGRDIGTAVAAALNLVIVLQMLYVNKTYNLLRTMTRLHSAMFVIFQLAVPWLLYTLVPGLLLCIVILWCLSLLYRIYGQEPCDTRKVFLVFLLLSGCASFDYTYVIYVPVMILATLQLRVFSIRSAIAIVLGLVTPWILMLGTGLVSVDELQLPFDSMTYPSLRSASMAVLAGITAFTCFVAVGSWVQNVVKIITYNARSRSMLSVVTVLTLITVLAALIDMAHVYSYLPLLNCCTALQCALLFTAIHNFPKSYIGVLSIVLIYLIMYIWNLMV